MKEEEVNRRTVACLLPEWDCVKSINNPNSEKTGHYIVALIEEKSIGIDHFFRRNYSGDPKDAMLVEDFGDENLSGMLAHLIRLIAAGTIQLCDLVMGMGSVDWEVFQELLPSIESTWSNPLITDRLYFLVHAPSGESKLIDFKGGETVLCQEKEKPPSIGEPKQKSGQLALLDFQS